MRGELSKTLTKSSIFGKLFWIFNWQHRLAGETDLFWISLTGDTKLVDEMDLFWISPTGVTDLVKHSFLISDW